MRRAALLICIASALVAATADVAIAAGPPAATTTPATNVAATSATLNGNVYPNKQDTTYHFEYGTTPAYGSRTPDAGPIGGNAGKDVSADVTGLSPTTTYHYRLVAANTSGTTNGADFTFTTPAAGPNANTVTIAANPPTVTFGKTTTIAGQVTGPNNGGVSVDLEQNPFPFQGGFTTVGTTTTDASGNYSFAGIAPTVNTHYHATAKASPTVTSADIAVNVRPRVTLRLSDLTPRRGQRVRFSGVVVPAHNGKTVKIQRRTSKGWRTIATPTLLAAKPVNGVQRSRYSRRIRIRRSGVYRTTFSPGDGDHVYGKSGRKRVRVH